ncbi:MAG: M23 family metallopeptidase [Myxococcaceae bacterium]
MTPLFSVLVSLWVASPLAGESAAMEVSVPFACGRAFVVSQAHAVGSHWQNDTWAWDFRMPEGVPIVAAQEGIVRLARGDSREGGCDAKLARRANYVVLRHANGVETQYLHLRDVAVVPGERVRAGKVLGHSGSTGWACGAHLHFKVARAQGNGWNNPSVPAKFQGWGDPKRGDLVSSPSCEP